MILFPIGMFKMGDVAKLTLIKSPFLLGETEVTQEIFENVMGYNPSSFIKKVDSKQRPVESVTWYDAVMFCNNLSVKLGKKPYYYITKIEGLKNIKDELIPNQIGYADVKINPQANGFRLPCEKEWEYAAKAGTNNKYAGTNDVKKLDQVAWFEDNSGYQTHPVKGKRPNEWGFYDMSGNVFEWCYDLFVSNSSALRVLRGGSWRTDASYLRSANRYYGSPSDRDRLVGFRVSASLVN